MSLIRQAALLAVAVLIGCGGTASVRTPDGDSEPGSRYRRIVRPFDVERSDGRAYTHPFLGGYNVPRPQFVDIDGDGDSDLFVQEYTGSVAFFENTGSREEPEFTWRTDKYEGLDVGEWYRFADVDLDSDLDLLAEQPYSYVRFYRNVGSTTEPDFALAVDTLRDDRGEAIFSDRQNIPNLTDLDCDGFADLFLGRLDGTVTRYEAVESGEATAFRLIAERFEDIQIVAQFGQPGTVTPMPNIPGNMPGNGPSASGEIRSDTRLHGANTMAFADIDSDGDKDLFWGDFFEPSVLLIENTGSCQTPNFRNEPQPFPPPDPLMSSGYNAPSFADINGDGRLDLFVGVLGGAFNPNRTAHANFYYYEQGGDGLFSLKTRRFLDQIDVGSESMPVFADVDADGDQDLFVSNKISAENSRTSVLLFLENTGSATAPSFAIRDSLNLIPSFHYAPAFADLDADGDLDLLLGTWNDGIALYTNAGSPQEPEFVLEQEAYVKLTRGSHSSPALVDIDADGDLDLFVGETSGTINFYRNSGSASAPNFELISDEYSGIDVGRRSVPRFLDVDRDGDYDLITGTEGDGLLFFENVGDRTNPRFAGAAAYLSAVPPISTPVFVDLDGDGVEELLVGGVSGGLYYFEADP